MSAADGTTMSEAETQVSWRPTRRSLAAILVAGALAVGLALYMRYGLVEPSSVGLACESGEVSTACVSRQIFIGMFRHEVFGIVALAATVLALLRPNGLLVGAALACGLMGAVLYNTGLSAIALSLLPLVLARPAPPREFQPE
jgi:hypothetical protein